MQQQLMMENYTQCYICFNKQQNAEKYLPVCLDASFCLGLNLAFWLKVWEGHVGRSSSDYQVGGASIVQENMFEVVKSRLI